MAGAAHGWRASHGWCRARLVLLLPAMHCLVGRWRLAGVGLLRAASRLQHSTSPPHASSSPFPACLPAAPRPGSRRPGFERSIRDIVAVVHIGEHTLSKRLYEFSSTSASAYTAGARVRARACSLLRGGAGRVQDAALGALCPCTRGALARGALVPSVARALRLARPDLACHLPPPPSSADEFEERAKQIEAEEAARLEAAAPTAAPAGLLESAGCEHLREWLGGYWGSGRNRSGTALLPHAAASDGAACYMTAAAATSCALAGNPFPSPLPQARARRTLRTPCAGPATSTSSR